MSTDNSNNSTNPFVKTLAITAFTIGVAFGGGIRHGLEAATEPADTPHMCKQVVTQASYEKLKTDMTLTEARSLLGPGKEISLSKETVTSVTIEWPSQHGTTLIAVFVDGKLTKKTQKRFSRLP